MNNDGLQQPTQFTPTPDTSNFIVPPPKKSNKGLIVLIITLVVLLLGALGTIAYLLFFQPKDTSTKDTTTTQQTTNDTAQKLADKVEAAINEQLKTTYPNLKVSEGTGSPAYKADGKDYAVYGNDFGVSLSVDTNPTAYDQTGQVAIERIIKETLDGEASLTSKSTDWQITYQSTDAICTTSLGSSPVSLSCANTADYSALIKQMEPFAKAYFASAEGKINKTGVAFATPTITKKATSFSNAVVAIGSTESPVGGFAGLFYAKDANWTYWRGTQSIINCKDYNTNDLQRAFEGDTCYDTKAKASATVKVTL